VQMLVEERLDLLLVDIAHGRRRNCDLIPILVIPLRRQGIYIFNIWVVEV
jgi:hypothetical protein